MKNQIFKNAEFGQIRTCTVDGETYFVGKDVALALGYINPNKAMIDHVDNEDKLTSRIVMAGQNRQVVVINESGLYALILSSKLESARRFKRWVTSEVLPAIRQNGRYDMWCKMQFFGGAIEAQEEAVSVVKKRGPQNLLDLLPEVFTREEANLMRQRQGICRGNVKMMLENWKKRGYIEPYGAKPENIGLQQYIKTETYLREHPQQSDSQLVN